MGYDEFSILTVRALNILTRFRRRRAEFFSLRRLQALHSGGIAECGLACLAMIARYHGHKTTLAALRSKYPLSINGTNLPTLADIARDLQLEPNAVRLDMDGLRVLRTPCILHWNMNHFVVLKTVSKDHLFVVDPDRGLRRVHLDVASASFTGIALELEPTSGFVPIDDGGRVLRFRDFFPQIRALKKYVIQILLLTGAVQTFAIASPLYMQIIVDTAIPKGDQQFLVSIALGFGRVTAKSCGAVDNGPVQPGYPSWEMEHITWGCA